MPVPKSLVNGHEAAVRLLPAAIPAAAAGIDHPRVSLIIPAMNEARNIGWVLDRVPDCVTEVVLVDGHSIDDTVEAARAVRPDIIVVSQTGRGKGAAVRSGFARASGDYLVLIDADGSMDPTEVDYYVTALDSGYDFAKGSRYLAGGGSLDLTGVRSLGNRALTSSVNAMWGVTFTDLCYGFLALRRDRLAELAPGARGFEIEAELIVGALNRRLRIAEVPSVELARQHGVSNLHAWRDGRRILRTLVRGRLSSRPSPVCDALDQVSVRSRPITIRPVCDIPTVVRPHGAR